MKDRIILLIKAKNLTAAQFADEIGVQKSSISHIISGRNNASLDFIQKVLLTYPEVNIEWLMFGKGPLFKPNETSVKSSDNGSLASIPPVDSAHVDLFSGLMPAKSADFRKENDLSSEKKEEDLKQQEDKGNEPIAPELKSRDIEVKELLVQKQENAQLSLVNKQNATKQMVKIVEFYSDNTFREYFPG